MFVETDKLLRKDLCEFGFAAQVMHTGKIQQCSNWYINVYSGDEQAAFAHNFPLKRYTKGYVRLTHMTICVHSKTEFNLT